MAERKLSDDASSFHLYILHLFALEQNSSASALDGDVFQKTRRSLVVLIGESARAADGHKTIADLHQAVAVDHVGELVVRDACHQRFQ